MLRLRKEVGRIRYARHPLEEEPTEPESGDPLPQLFSLVPLQPDVLVLLPQLCERALPRPDVLVLLLHLESLRRLRKKLHLDDAIFHS